MRGAARVDGHSRRIAARPLGWSVAALASLVWIACGDAGGAVSEPRVPGATACTLVIGYSQVAQWYEADGGFEAGVDDARWELLWKGGAGIDRWQDPHYGGWSRTLHSPCASGAAAPDRVLLSISGPYGADEARWAAAIEATVAVIRERYPSASQIVLQPVVGGPGHEDCFLDGEKVRASWQHAHIDAAIAAVADGTEVVAGPSPEVRSCADYRDVLGHLTPDGAAAAGRSLAAEYAGG